MTTDRLPEASLDGLPLPTLLLDDKQQLVAANRVFKETIGDPSAHAGEGLDALFDPRDRRNVRAFHRAMSRHRGGVLVAEVKLKVGGESCPVRLHMQSGDAGWLVTAISTAHEQEATASLQQTRSNLRAILSCMSDGLLVLDTDQKVRDCNQAALATFRFTSSHGVLLSQEAITGRDLGSLFAEDVAASIGERVAAVSDDPDRVEQLSVRHGERSLVLTVNPIFVPRKGFQGACITARDLTEIESLHSQISATNADMRRVMDNVQQGLLTVDAEGVISTERSAVFDTWAGDCPPGTTLFDAIGRLSEEASISLEMGWDQMFCGFLPLELCLDQLPSHFSSGDRHFSLSYEPILADEELERVLVMMTDTTAEIQRQAAEALQKESVKAFECIGRDRGGFETFYRDAQRIVALVGEGPGDDLATFARELHTLKGNSGVMGLAGMVDRCHELENRLAEREGTLSGEDTQPLLSWWRSLCEHIDRFLTSGSDQLLVDPDDFVALEQDIAECLPHPELLERFRSLRQESARVWLRRLGRQASALAQRLGKGEITVEIEDSGVRLDGERWKPFWSSLVHIIRNAVDHGLEPPEARAAAGKDAPPTLWLRSHLSDDALSIVVEDNGAGIRWEAIAAKAAAAGLPCDTEEQRVAALFADGVSSRDVVTDTSGRGVGTAAVAEAVRALGGTVQVDSRPGQGARFHFSFPRRGRRAA